MALVRIPKAYVPGAGALDMLASFPLGYGGPWSNTVDLPFRPKGMHVSVAGNIHYDTDGVGAARFENTEAFEIGWHPCGFHRIYVLNTTATVTVWI